jgi:DNA mismatch repair ATPase MutS
MCCQADGELLKHTTVCPYTLYTGAMRLDGPTLANLELVESAEGGREVGSHLSILRGIFVSKYHSAELAVSIHVPRILS